jgi:hypothetical protein
MEVSVLFKQWNWLEAKIKEASNRYFKYPTAKNEARIIELLGRLRSYKREVDKLIDEDSK